ncbi:MAG: ribbon-helix-helix protein, CopG family [Chloroflexi bacterium]|nr:ribbon-helix-helix protein, CopG family [Chloroflexota bacterium]
MTTITVELPKERAQKLQELAQTLGVSAEELIRVSVEELLARPEEQFTKAVEHVLRKNSELYKRLAA